jgi:SAM-dependent methyltransferase
MGLDPGLADVAEARARGVYRMVVTADSGAIPFPGAWFGSVFSNCVFEHIPDIDRTVAEIARVIKPGGVFACTVVGERFSEFLTDRRVWARLGLRRLHATYLRWFNRKSIHYHFDPPEKWKARFDEAGFEVRSWRYYLSPSAAHVFHWNHYVSLPHLVARRLTGRWVPFPALSDNSFWIRRFLPYVEEPEPRAGSCIAFVCERKR